MQALNEVLTNPFIVTFLVLLSAVVIEALLPWPDKYHPLSLWRLLSAKMAKKVLPSNKDTTKQHRISGALACIILLLPACIIIAIFHYLPEYPLFFEALFLMLALRQQTITQTTKRVAAYLTHDKKRLARETLAPIVLRETEALSPLGINKASCESLILRFNYQFCAVVFWFVITGGVGALLYRLLYDCTQQWNTKLASFRHFGWFIRVFTSVLQWPPSMLAGISLAITGLTFKGFKALTSGHWLNPRMLVLNVVGASLDYQLSGPAYYNGIKKRHHKCGGVQLVTVADIKRTYAFIIMARSLWLCISLLIYVTLYATQH